MTNDELESILKNRQGKNVSPAPWLFICKDEYGVEHLLCRDSFLFAPDRLKMFLEFNFTTMTLIKDYATQEDIDRLSVTDKQEK